MSKDNENVFEGFGLLSDDQFDVVKSNEPIIEPKKAKVKTPKNPEPEPEPIVDPEPIVEPIVEPEPIIEPELEPEPEGSFIPFIKHFADKGVLDIDDSEELEDTEEALEQVVERTVTTRVKNGINGYKQSLPEDGQKFLEFVENGGNPSDFHKYYYNEATFENFDIYEEENQKYVVKEALKLEGYSDEEAEDEIEDAIDLGKLEKKAAKHLKKLQKIEKEQKELLVESQKAYAKQQQELQKQEWDNFKKGLYDKEAILGFKVTEKVKNDIWDYMTKPVDKKTGTTQYQKDMDEKGAEARYLYAWLMKTGFDISKLEKLVETKQVSKLRGKLGNFSDSRNKVHSGSASRPTTTDNPFKGFENFLKD